ncbi:efflux RND transporter permease subunit [Litorivicinus sp.]|nr:efflux RND transporter permease subunit [Litorivicinus sp.]MEC9077216.1 efflux RND transporter permease subunit [Pseudomonadota bacterium]
MIRFVHMFAKHRVAANLLMVIMIIAGAIGVDRLRTQFFPTFELDIITVSVAWSGATAEDVQEGLTIPIENAVEELAFIESIDATSQFGSASFRIEIVEGTNLPQALDDISQRIDQNLALPEGAEDPMVSSLTRYEDITNLLITGPLTPFELQKLALQAEQELLARGIRKVDFRGLPTREMQIETTAETLASLGLTLDTLADRILTQARDLPAGTAGRDDGERQLRSLEQGRTQTDISNTLIALNGTRIGTRLGDIATVRDRVDPKAPYLTFRGQPAVEIIPQRTENDSTLTMAEVTNQWIAETQPQLPIGTQLIVLNERWQYLNDRINLLLKNGFTGLLFVVIILYLFLNQRVAFWVTLGIPVSFLATLAILWMIGGTINMISLFGMIMALGVIVDDAIVVAEDTLSLYQSGQTPVNAALHGSERMLAPVVSSSLTTIAAFSPLLIVGGVIGSILQDIPIIVICVIVASLIECFLILPGHLQQSLNRGHRHEEGKIRQTLDRGFINFRDNVFKPFVGVILKAPALTLVTALTLFILSVGLISGGRVKFTFFPSIDGTTLWAGAQFTTGTTPYEVDEFLNHLEDTAQAVNEELGDQVIRYTIQQHRQLSTPGVRGGTGDHYGTLKVILTGELEGPPNDVIIDAWRDKIRLPGGIEKFSIRQAQGGPPSKPIEIKLTGGDAETLKAASLEVQNTLRRYPGVSNIDDDLPFGAEQLVVKLTPQGRQLDLSSQQLARQLRGAFEGRTLQTFYEDGIEVDVLLSLSEIERNRLATLDQLPIVTSSGAIVTLPVVASFEARRGLDKLRRTDGQMSIVVSADVNNLTANAAEILTDVRTNALPQVTAKYGLKSNIQGRAQDREETFADMKVGVLVALTMIYIILAWVFSSYSWPFAVLIAIPLGLTGAISGHWMMGLDLTVLSLFGFFGLSGIVINDSIVLVDTYRRLIQAGEDHIEAIVKASCLRFRAVLVTSLTTIAGLTPILFETSPQAQFLIPMATTIVFGLAYGTVLVLMIVPSVLSLIERNRNRTSAARSEYSVAEEPSQ